VKGGTVPPSNAPKRGSTGDRDMNKKNKKNNPVVKVVPKDVRGWFYSR
jgi:hypothetical protein